jgi:hypothetical protein
MKKKYNSSIYMFIQKFKIDTDKIKKRNEELMSMNWFDKLSIQQKKFLDFRKGPPKQLLNKDGLYGYPDLSNYLVNPDKFSEISISNLQDYLMIFNIEQEWEMIWFSKINDDLKKILKKIQEERIKNIQKYIKLEDSIFNKGIYANDIVYRVQDKPIEGNIIKNSTSWSLAPIENFCDKTECHMYVTQIPKKLKVIYLENKSKDKNLKTFQQFNMYEFEFVLPRNLEFKELKTKTYSIPNRKFNFKNEEMSKPKEQKFIVHYIKIIKKLNNVPFPTINNVKLISQMT